MFEKICRFFAVTFFVAGIFFVLEDFTKTFAAPNSQTQWYWLNSDDKYSKFFDPDSVKVIRQAKIIKKIKNATGEVEEFEKIVPTEIEAWTKTAYTYEGAAETISNYKINSTLTDPKILSYSLALFKIIPQARTVQYVREDFYNANNQIIWSRADGPIKEINSQSFDEDFYCAIVDEIFKQGEVERKKASDRWIDLWTHTNAEGYTTSCTGDTTTMQMKDTNLILWIWQETKNSAGKTVEIKFLKKAVNLQQGTEKITDGEIWTPTSKGLIKLRSYVKGFSTWVGRYSIS